MERQWLNNLFVLSSRIYSLKVPQTPVKVIALSEAEEETSVVNKGYEQFNILLGRYAPQGTK